jgi:hypothetical protein
VQMLPHRRAAIYHELTIKHFNPSPHTYPRTKINEPYH